MNNDLPWNLITAKLKSDISEKENDELTLWLSIENNQSLYDEIETLWISIQAEVADYNPDVDALWLKLTQRIEHLDTSQITQSHIRKSKRLWSYAAVACVAILISVLVNHFILPSINGNQEFYQTYNTLGGKSKITLVDGTEVWLHENTSISYNTNFGSSNRTVKLEGEAFFTVAKDLDKPFIVETNQLAIKVHGTQFNVKTPLNSNETFVSLLEGSISLLTESKDERFIQPGEIAIYNKDSKNLSVQKGDVEFEKSWCSEQIVFEKKNLGYICRYLSKRYSADIKLDPSLTDKYLYTFTLKDESLEEIMRLMSRLHPIAYQFQENDVLLISKR